MSKKPDSASARRDDATGASRRQILKAGALATAVGMTSAGAEAKTPDVTARRLASAKRYIVKNATILTVDKTLGDFESGDMLVEGGKIKGVGRNISAGPDALVIDGANRIVIPGFIDTHSHSYQGLLRGLLPNGVVLPDYDRDIQKNITAHYTAKDAYNGVLITALGFLDVGTTSVIDISQVSHSRDHVEATLQALKDSGMRAMYAMSRGIGPDAQYPDAMKYLLPEHFASSDQLLTPALATAVDKETFEAARRYGLRAVLHIRINSGPLIALSQAGLLQDGDVFVHCTHLNKDAWRVIHDTGARTSHSPVVEMAMGHGYPAIQDALDAGGKPSFSCDHAATVGMDMFGMMRTAFNLQRLAIQQRQRNGEKDTQPLLTCREVLEFATLQGARCAGLDHRTGSLTPGKDADFIMLRADDFGIWPINNAHAAVVNLMHAGHVESVFVAGKPRKWKGEMVGVDKPKVLREVAQSRADVLKRANFNIGLTA